MSNQSSLPKSYEHRPTRPFNASVKYHCTEAAWEWLNAACHPFKISNGLRVIARYLLLFTPDLKKIKFAGKAKHYVLLNKCHASNLRDLAGSQHMHRTCYLGSAIEYLSNKDYNLRTKIADFIRGENVNYER